MIPAPFDYARARTLDEALDLVAGADPSIRVLAGGQSLIPLMKVRLARPERLVDLGRLAELRGVRDGADGGLRIGALTTWAALLEDDRVVRCGALADVLPVIGDVQVRNMGTIGGSLAHADPASDIGAPALALDFEVVVRSAARGERSILVRDLFAGPFATTIAPDEILTEVRIRGDALSAPSAYHALPQPASGYPIAGVAVSLGPVAIGVTGVGEMPYRAVDVESAVTAGTPFHEAVLAIASGQRVASDIHADRDYRAAMAVVMARRAFAAAEGRGERPTPFV
ncbi:MAG: aerobic carbon-monoxide dehydrogenase medium subunit [Chloroflexota bacterium]|jgi:carbon-monoxide dehydrogenase medium subunit|nr:aerobic carbon-monoxide dehydrogenase medium subunit [Chloroflexota bacterium]